MDWFLLEFSHLSRGKYMQLECPELQFSGPNKLGRVEYFQHLGNSKFCLTPRGESSWTLRFYESFFVVSLSFSNTCTQAFWGWWSYSNLLLFFHEQECVPVILSDQVELPFQNVIDYTEISIKWPSTSIGPELLDYLASIPGQIFYFLLLTLLTELFSIMKRLNFAFVFQMRS